MWSRCRKSAVEVMMDKLQKFCVISLTQGGKHADNTVDLQEFMIMPVGAEKFEEGIRMCVEIYQILRIILKERSLSTAVGDEGGFAPDLADSQEVLALIVQAVEKAGYKPGEDILIAIDAAASELYDENLNCYYFPGESQMKGKEVLRDSGEMIAYYEELVRKFPIISIEDGLHEDDWEGWKEMTERLGKTVQLVGDDLFVTNIKRLKCGIQLHAANAILVKVNQIGTLSEAMDAVEMAQKIYERPVKVTKDIYPVIARKYKSTPSNVEHNIRTLVNLCWMNHKDTLEEMAGCTMADKPTNSEFIDILVYYLRYSDKD